MPAGLPPEAAAQMGDIWMPQQDGFLLPLGYDIVTTLMESTDDQTLCGLQPEDLERVGLTRAQAHALALENLERLAREGVEMFGGRQSNWPFRAPV